jgi:acyl-CoA synthetase (AMP-forming)/AMP-acid ligase II
MLVMPLFHVHGLLCALLAPLFSGGSMVVPTKFSASDFWLDFIAYKANWYTAVPTIHQILLKNAAPNPLPYIRFIRSCSSPLSPTVFDLLEKTYKAPVLEAYAMTEAAHQMTSNPLPPAKRKPGTVGLGQGVEVVILDDAGDAVPQGTEGEICIKGENVTKGYLNNAAANATAFTKTGYFRTGDQGKKDADGYVIITGRIKELINKGGEKISPIELDNVLTRHPAVSEAVSFAIPDDLYGQDIAVAIVLKPGQTLVADDLKKWVEEKLAKFKVPKKVLHCPRTFFIAELITDTPRSTSPRSCPRRRRARFNVALWPRRCRSKRQRRSCRETDADIASSSVCKPCFYIPSLCCRQYH